MSARQGVYVSVRRPWTPPPSPNSTVAAITAELRIYWPPNATRGAVESALWSCVDQALDEIEEKMYDR